jgi:heat shock protein HslJ
MALAGVAAGASDTSDTTVAGPLDSTNWSLTTIGSGDASTAGVTLDFVGKDAGGSVGCDRYLATYAADATALTFDAVETTRTPCDETTQAVAMSYLTALPTVAAYTTDGGVLTLTDATGTPVLTFASAPMPWVEGTWVALDSAGASATGSPSPDGGHRLAFSPGGRVLGDGGCNTFEGPYAVNADEIAIGPLMSTTKSCGADPDANELGFLTALQQAFTWDITSDRLELKDYDGQLVVTAEAAPRG